LKRSYRSAGAKPTGTNLGAVGSDCACVRMTQKVRREARLFEI
jgi:hypothetical protein